MVCKCRRCPQHARVEPLASQTVAAQCFALLLD
jgi:hypothetical protein